MLALQCSKKSSLTP